MTVGELMEALADLPDDTTVYVRDFHGHWEHLDEVHPYRDRVDLDAY